MVLKVKSISLVLILLVIFFSGCSSQETEKLSEETMEKIKQEEKLAVGEITHPKELETLAGVLLSFHYYHREQ